MVSIPEGEITLRDDRIKSQWKVAIPAFSISRYPVTQDLYFQVTGKSPSIFKGGNLPVENVSWQEAINFCELLSKQEGGNAYRLPTEAEWEYACKAGTAGARYGDIDQIAWYKGNSRGKSHEVGLKQPNEWGLYDILGNVWEWCSDLYDESEYGSYRIFRGGGWNDEARGCLSTNRRRSHPTSFRIDDLGFRLARNN